MYALRMTKLTKVSVNLIPRAYEALCAAADREGESRTDAMNRAIQLYDHITREKRGGVEITLESSDGEKTRLVVL